MANLFPKYFSYLYGMTNVFFFSPFICFPPPFFPFWMKKSSISITYECCSLAIASSWKIPKHDYPLNLQFALVILLSLCISGSLGLDFFSSSMLGAGCTTCFSSLLVLMLVFGIIRGCWVGAGDPVPLEMGHTWNSCILRLGSSAFAISL